MEITACYISDTGKIRSSNEDSILLDDLVVSGASMREPQCMTLSSAKHVCFVADGMGGHLKGEVASRKVLESFQANYREAKKGDDLLKIARLAKEELNRYVLGDRSGFGLGTTLSGIMFIGGKATILNCGDSRVYMSNGRYLVRLTKDHSVVQKLYDSGAITEDEMRSHPHKNIITSALIGDLKESSPELFSRELKAEVGQRFLICTDGLWESMPVGMMEECFQSKEPAETARCLFAGAMESGRDNISLIVLEVIGE